MFEYLKNIIPRVKKYSKDLNKIENFVDINWVYIDDDNNTHEYLFLRDKRLIMTLNDVTKEGTWELLPTGQLLIDRRENNLLKLENLFVEKALLVLKKSVTADTPFVLINQNLIPDLNVIAYLENYELEEEKRHIPESEQKYKVLSSGELSGPPAFAGKVIKTFNDEILTGSFKLKRNEISYEEWVEINLNTVKKVYCRKKYMYKEYKLLIEQRDFDTAQTGDFIVNGEEVGLPIDKEFKITSMADTEITIKVNSKYKITKAINNDIYLGYIIIIFLLLFITMAVIASIS